LRSARVPLPLSRRQHADRDHAHPGWAAVDEASEIDHQLLRRAPALGLIALKQPALSQTGGATARRTAAASPSPVIPAAAPARC
jgi:hypothetical protein